MSRLKYSFLLLPLAFILGVFVTTVITSVFAHGGDLNFIHACVKVSNGSLRIVGASDTCGSNETALDWKSDPDLPWTCTNCNIRAEFIGDRMAGKDMSGAMLINTNFYYINLKNTNFTNSFLDSVNFDHSDLTGADFRGSQKSSHDSFLSFDGATMIGVNLSGLVDFPANFSGANLTNANLTNANFADSLFIASNLTDVVGSGANLSGSEATVANFTNANFSGADLSRIRFMRSILRGINATGANFANANFSNEGGEVDATLANFTNANLSQAVIPVNLTQANLSGVIAPGASFSYAHLDRTNFTNANLQNAGGIDGATGRETIIWSNTTCPDGTNSDNNGNTCEGHLNP